MIAFVVIQAKKELVEITFQDEELRLELLNVKLSKRKKKKKKKKKTLQFYRQNKVKKYFKIYILF